MQKTKTTIKKETMDETRSKQLVSAQIGVMGAIEDLTSENFKLDIPFNLKNDGETAITLEVNLYGMEPGVFVETRFEVGWNPEILREIKMDASLNTYDLKYGY